VKCPKCGTQMSLFREFEQNNKSEKLVRVYYKCPICGFKRAVEEIQIDAGNGTLRITVKPAAARRPYP